jgi:hypothetical protein
MLYLVLFLIGYLAIGIILIVRDFTRHPIDQPVYVMGKDVRVILVTMLLWPPIYIWRWKRESPEQRARIKKHRQYRKLLEMKKNPSMKDLIEYFGGEPDGKEAKQKGEQKQ